MYGNVVEFSRNGFYQEKNDIIEEAVMRYDKIRLDSENLDDIENIRNESERALGLLMTDSGFKNKRLSYIDIEKEFYPEGSFDRDSLEKFKKTVILHYSEQQLKWSFWGTAKSYSQISKKGLLENGTKYDTLVPAGALDHDKKTSLTKDNPSFRFYLYPDGSVSERYFSNKAIVGFNNTSDKSGFNWDSEYSPSNKVERKGKEGAFNDKGEWESVNISDNSDEKTFSVSNNSAYDEFGSEVGFVFAKEFNEIILFDVFSTLERNKSKKYYTSSGELYGVQEVDIVKSVQMLEETLKRNKGEHLTGVVISDDQPETVNYYRKILGGMVDDKTVFFTANSKVLNEKLEEIKQTKKQAEIRAQLGISFYKALSLGCSDEEEIYSAMTPSVIDNNYSASLDIFADKNNMNLFLEHETIKSVLTPEESKFIEEIKLEPELLNSKNFSNVIQNVVHNKKIFKDSGYSIQDVIATVLSCTGKGEDSHKSLKVSGEISLKKIFDSMSQSGTEEGGNDILFLSGSYSKKEASPEDLAETAIKRSAEWNMTRKSEFCVNPPKTEEMQNYGIAISDESRRNLFWRIMAVAAVSYPEISSASGLDFSEIADAVENYVINGMESEAITKKVFINRDILDIISDMADVKPPRLSIKKKDIYSASPVHRLRSYNNIFDADNAEILANSPYLIRRGFSEEERAAIINSTKNSKVEEENADNYSEIMSDFFDSYNDKVRMTGISVSDSMKMIEHYVSGREYAVPIYFRKLIRSRFRENAVLYSTDSFSVAGNLKVNSPDTEMTFAETPVFDPNAARLELEKNASFVLSKNYDSEIKPLGYSESEAFSSAENLLNGRSENSSIEPLIHNLLRKDYIESNSGGGLLSISDSLNNILNDNSSVFAGLNQNKVRKLIDIHSKAYSAMKREIVTPVKLKYRSVTSENSASIVSGIPSGSRKNISVVSRNNNVYSIDSVVFGSNAHVNIPKSFSNSQTNFRSSVSARAHEVSKSFLDFPELTFASSSSGKNSFLNTDKNFTPKPVTTGETSRMDQINANYETDRRMLAKSGDETQMPASPSKNSGSDYKITKAFDELFNEFLFRIGGEM